MTSVNQSINKSLFANAISQVNKQKEEMCQAARTGNRPTKLATLRQTDRETDVT